MKKKMITILSLICLTAVFTIGCGSKSAKDSGSSNQSKNPSGTSSATNLEELFQANTFDQLLSSHKSISYDIKMTMADGTEVTSTLYKDNDMYAIVQDTDIMIDQKGDIYGFDSSQNVPYRMLFIDDSYQEYADGVEFTNVFDYDEAEKIVSEETKDGMIYVTTEMKENLDSEDYSDMGYDFATIDSITTEYEIDADTKAILGLKQYIISGEDKNLYAEQTTILDGDKYQVDEQITEAVFGDDSRTLTAITDVGTDQEKTYTQTVTKGSAILVYPSTNYDADLYTDSECTKPLEVANRESDSTIYLKRASD